MMTSNRQMPGRRCFYHFLAAMILAAAIMLSGCGEEDGEVSGGDAQLGALEVRPEVTVASLVDPFETGDPADIPTGGGRLVLVEVTITNASSEELFTGPADFQLEAGDGSRHAYYFDYDGEGALPTLNTLSAGSSISGAIVYELPAELAASALIEKYGDGEERIELPLPAS